jgi:hypothetical protein
LKAAIDDLAARRPCHRNGTHRGRPIYSSTYAANGSVLLALLAAATVPASLVTIAFALDRIERRAGRAAVTQLVLVMLVVGSRLLLMRKLSINGAGLIWFDSSFIVAAVRFPAIARAGRQPMPRLRQGCLSLDPWFRRARHGQVDVLGRSTSSVGRRPRSAAALPRQPPIDVRKPR